MYSRRLDWGAHTNPLSLALDQRRAEGARILDLTSSNPTDVGIAVPEGLLRALGDERALRYRPDPQGDGDARRAIARYYAERGDTVDAERLLLTSSTSEAYAYLFKLLCDPGDAVLVPRPSYPLFDYLAALESVQLVPYELGFDGHWFLDGTALERAASSTPRVRAVLVVHPNNPTGSLLAASEVDALVALGLPLVSDEVFSDYRFASAGARVRSLVGETRTQCFVLSGLSKVLGLPQLKLGWIHVGGPDAAGALARLELIADTYLSVGAPVQLAAPSLLAHAPSLRGAIAARVGEGLARVRAGLAGSAATVLPVDGGWYVTLQLPRTRTDEAWALALLDEGVLVQPGYFYDFAQEAMVVLSLLTPAAILDEGVALLRALLGR